MEFVSTPINGRSKEEVKKVEVKVEEKKTENPIQQVQSSKQPEEIKNNNNKNVPEVEIASDKVEKEYTVLSCSHELSNQVIKDSAYMIDGRQWIWCEICNSIRRTHE